MDKKNKLVGFLLLFLILSTSFVYAEEIIVVVTAIIKGEIIVPNEIDYGSLYMGYVIDEQILFKVNTTSTGAIVNVTLINASGEAQYQMRKPDGSTVILTPNNTMMLELPDIGNYTLKILPYKIGAVNGIVKFKINETFINYTRY